MEGIFLGLTASQWLDAGISLLIVIVIVIISRWLITTVLDRGAKRITKRTQTTLDDAILNALRQPLFWLAFVLALDFAINRLDFLSDQWNGLLDDTFYVLYLLIGFFFAGKLLSGVIQWYGDEITIHTKTDLDEQLMPFFRRIAMAILWLIGIITLLGHFEVDISAMVTTLGIGSLAIALAAQEALSDTISGLIIMIDRPFRIGDRIEIQALDTWGDVVDIGLRSSRIRTRDNRMVIVPNSVIGKSLVVNYSYPDTQYRTEVHIGIGYDSDIEHAREIMIDTVRGIDGVLSEKRVEALLMEFGDAAMIFRVRWWMDSYYDARRMVDKVNSALYNALADAGIEMPYPHLDVSLITDSPSET